MKTHCRLPAGTRGKSIQSMLVLFALIAMANPPTAHAQQPLPQQPPPQYPPQPQQFVPAPVAPPPPSPYGAPTYVVPPPPPPLAIPTPAPQDETRLPEPRGMQLRADPAWTEFFWLPTARTLRARDVAMQYVGYLGWVGFRYGVLDDFDLGIGLHFLGAGVTADVRAALMQTESMAFSVWGMVQMPLHRDLIEPHPHERGRMDAIGMLYFAGPLLSVWGETAGIHAGLQVAGTTLGRVTLLGHATVEVRMGGSVKVILQSLNIFALNEPFQPCTAYAVTTGSGASSVLPNILAGLRVHSRRVAIDVGLEFPIHGCFSPGGVLEDWIAYPMLSIHHLR